MLIQTPFIYMVVIFIIIIIFLVIVLTLVTKQTNKQLISSFNKLAEEFNGDIINSGRIDNLSVSFILNDNLIRISTEDDLYRRFGNHIHVAIYLINNTINTDIKKTISIKDAIDYNKLKETIMTLEKNGLC